MRIAIIGRSTMLYNVMLMAKQAGHEIALVVTAKEAPEYVTTAEDFKNYAYEIGAPFIHKPAILEADIIQILEEIEGIELGISINYTGIISQKIIDLFKIGILNMHAGDLPRYRGNAVVAWAMLNQEKQIVNCIHKMIGGELDSGDILYKDYFELNSKSKIGHVFEWLEKRAPIIFEETLKKLEKDPDYILERQSKNIEDSLRCYPRKPEDGQIYWHKSAHEIDLLIRACSEPFSGAFTSYNEQKLIIWSAEIFQDDEPFLAIPGQICDITEEGLVVACGKGKILLREVDFKNQRINPNGLIKSARDRFK